MDILMIVLRIIHIFSGVFWVGVSFFNVSFLQPTVQATGAEGQKVMQHLAGRTRFLTTTYAAATLSLLSGLTMYWKKSGFQLSFVRSGYGLFLTIGGIAGLITWIIVIFVVRNIFSQMAAMGRQIQSQGSPPTAEQTSAMRALGAQLAKVGRIGAGILIIALLGMSIAQYMTF